MDLKLDEIAGFRASNWRTVFRIGRKRYRLQPAGVVAIRLAVKILKMTEAKRSLLGLRSEIRQVRKYQCKAALIHLIDNTKNEELRVIAVWLRGLCGGYLGMDAIAKLAASDSETTRRKVAGALQRMSGWSTLKQMAATDPSTRVRRIASPREPREFRSRLSRFAGNSHSLPVIYSATKRQLYIANEYEVTQTKGAKSAEFIRAVLERIRVLVRGNVEAR